MKSIDWTRIIREIQALNNRGKTDGVTINLDNFSKNISSIEKMLKAEKRKRLDNKELFSNLLLTFKWEIQDDLYKTINNKYNLFEKK